MKDTYGKLLEQVGDVVSALEKHGVEADAIEAFQRACSPFTDLSYEERAAHFAQILPTLAEAQKQLSGRKNRTRSGNLFPQSLLAQTVSVIVQTLDGCLNLLPAIIPLIDDLMGVRSTPLTSPKNRPARQAAVYLFAVDPASTMTGVAKKIGVSKTTVSKWLKDNSFISDVDFWKNSIQDQRNAKIAKDSYHFNLHLLGKLKTNQ